MENFMFYFLNTTQAQGGKNWLLPAILFGFVIFYYFVIVRPQSKKEKEVKNRLKNLQKGDKVVTIGGIHGKVSAVKANEIVIKVDSNTEITFEKSAIAKFIDPNPPQDKKNKKGDELITTAEPTVPAEEK